MGDEVQLQKDLVTSLKRKQVNQSSAYKRSSDLLNNRWGSENISLLADAVILSQDPSNIIINDICYRYLTLRPFMGIEPLSRNYSPFFLKSILTMYEFGLPRVVEAARKWLQNYWALAALSAGKAADKDWYGFALTLCGARSFARAHIGGVRIGEPYHFHKWGVDVVFARAIGLIKEYPKKFKDEAYTLLDRNTNYGLDSSQARLLRDYIQTKNQPFNLWEDVQKFITYKFIKPVKFAFIITGQGSATVCLRPINSNTAPLYAVTWTKNDGLQYLALDKGTRNEKDINLGTASYEVDKANMVTIISASNELTQKSIWLPGVVRHIVEVGYDT